VTFRVTFLRYDEALWSFSPSVWPSFPHIAPSAVQNTQPHQLAFRAGGSQEQVSLCVRKKNVYNTLCHYVNTFISIVQEGRREDKSKSLWIDALSCDQTLGIWELDAFLLDFKVSRLFHSLLTIFKRVGSSLLLLFFFSAHIRCICVI